MPYPLSQVHPHAGIQIGNAGQRPFVERPALGGLAMEAVASWSNVESFMLRLFIELVGGHGSVAADMFLALDGSGPKKAAISAAASSVLSPENLELLRAVMAIADIGERQRNKLAHWTWGISPQLPNALLLLDPKSIIRLNIGELRDTINEKVYVYTEEDFQQIISANDRLCGYGLRLQFILSGHPENQDGRLFQQLSEEVEIADRLRILRVRQARSTSEAHPQSPLPGTYA